MRPNQLGLGDNMPKKGSTRQKSSDTVGVNGLTLDLANRRVREENGVHHLTPTECRPLKTFVIYPGKVLPRELLMKKVWGTNYLKELSMM